MLTDVGQLTMASTRILWHLLGSGVLQLMLLTQQTQRILMRSSQLIIIMHSFQLATGSNYMENLALEKSISSQKCTYNFVIHEVDSAVNCPSLQSAESNEDYDKSKDISKTTRHRHRHRHKSAQIQGDEGKLQPQTRIMHKAYLRTMEDLINRVSQLETKLYQEVAENRELKNTLLVQEQVLQRTERRLELTLARNLTHLHDDVRRMQVTMDKYSGNYRSLDNKVAEVMLDVAEVNNYLATGKHKTAEEEKQVDKYIMVQATSHLNTGCSIPPNSTHFRDCQDVLKKGHRRSGVYYVTPIYSPCPIPVYCDMDTPPGGWLVLQRRSNGRTSFNRNWYEYRMGFGDISREFWIGNDNLFLLTNQAEYTLRVDLWDFYGSRVFAEYSTFKVDGERDKFRLHVHNYTGTAGDGFSHHNGIYFSTPDEDNDAWDDYHCAKEWGAGWWYNNCWFVILNGRYYNTTKIKYRGISWNEWKPEQLQRSEMKIRPKDDY